jgi:predicted MFS family arabinose efflux permease
MVASEVEARPGLLLPVAGGILALAAAMGIGRFAYTPVLPAMQRAAHFTTAQAGLLAAANYAGYLAGALLIIVAVPVSARRAVLLGSLVAIAVTTALMATTTDLRFWGVVRFLSGLASAGVFVLTSSLVLDALRHGGRAARSGWLYTGPAVGIAGSGIAVRAAGRTLDWRGDWLLLSILASAVLLPCWHWLPRGAGDVGAAQRISSPVTRSRTGLALLCVAYFLEGLGYIVTGTFLVAIVTRQPGLETVGAGVWIVVGLAGIPSVILWSAWAGRIGHARALALAFGAQACGIVLPLFGGIAAALGAAILFGGTFLGISALTLTLAASLSPGGTSRLFAVFTAVYGLGQMIGPVLGGIAAGRADSFAPALVAAAAVIAIGGALMLAVQRFDPSRRAGARVSD